MEENNNGFVEKIKKYKNGIAVGLVSVAGMIATYNLGKLQVRKNNVVFTCSNKDDLKTYKSFFAGTQKILGGVIAHHHDKDLILKEVTEVLESGADCTYGLLLEKRAK